MKTLLLTEFSVENFGVFSGKHIFDFRTIDNHHPIILFGGRNGSGKTTLFEGIKLCLYGASFRGERLPRTQYEDFLRGRVHRRHGLVESEGSGVSLEFEHVHQGKLSKYFVRRHWTTEPETINERLEVLRDGNPLNEVSPQQLQDFLVELIPLGLSRLFFFDGEMIQRLAEDEPDNRNLIDAFDALLGIDILENLQTDLRIHLSRQTRELSTAPELSYDGLSEENKAISVEAGNLRQSLAQKQTEIDHISAEVERREHELASRGGGFAERRKNLSSKRAQVEAEIVFLENDLREMASSLFPFALAPKLCTLLREKLYDEQKYQQELAASEFLQQASDSLEEKLRTDEFWSGLPIEKELRATIGSRLLDTLRSIVRFQKQDNPAILHGLSQSDRERIFHCIDSASNKVPKAFRGVASRLEMKARELQDLDVDLARSPPDEAISPIIQQLNELNQQVGELNHQSTLLRETLRQAEARLAENQRKIAVSIEQQERISASRQRIELGKHVQQTLRDFAESLRRERIIEISERFVEAFNQLSAKRSLISKVQIDPDTFSTTLLRTKGPPTSKESLSAGEKQIYAVAMLTALARVSGKPLPFVIDTPLARLDSEHRTNLVARFFPFASHQVIVFSTNSEIDREQFSRMKPFTSKAYLLRYDDSSDHSVVSPGYFWENPPEMIV